ncbi:unnamed protein product [Blepharisma stoltei]|uniref:PRELI/MSF1 domain-containing protein n=1 Tax=Blepharisma stoltei TaxID=1481888 RepID=A0AAU9IV89_9CILI|nr:unnamed protein product [Blepharisma stoltei]
MVARAYLAKYPHRKLSHIEYIDTLERYVDEEGRLITTRVLVSSFMKFSSIIGLERSAVDLERQELNLATDNITHRQLSKVNEVCKYTVGEDNTTHYAVQWTLVPDWRVEFLAKKVIREAKYNFNKGVRILEDIMRTKFNIPLFDSPQSFVEIWNEVNMRKKFKLLKKSVSEVDYFKNIDGKTFAEVIKVLAHHKEEVDTAFKYMKAFSESQEVDKIIDFMSLKEKKDLEELLNVIKERHEKAIGPEPFEELYIKFGLLELNKI